MIFKIALVLLKTGIVYALLVFIETNVTSDKFQNFYYIAVFVSIYIWIFDFGAFFDTSKNGLEASGDKICRNLLIQFLCSPLIFSLLSIFFAKNIALLMVIFSTTSYLLLILKSTFISRDRIISSLFVDYFTMIPLYGLFYIYSDLFTALCVSIVIQLGLLLVSHQDSHLIFKRPSLKFEKFDKEMLVSNVFSLSGSYVDVFFARYFVGDLSLYILVREAILKIPSLLQPIYNNIFFPILLKDVRLFEKFFIFNALFYVALFLLGGSTLSLYFSAELINEMSLLLGVLVVLKGLSSLHGALMMSKLASDLSMIKNIVYLVVFILASSISYKFLLDFRGWMIVLISFYGFGLAYDIYILRKVNVLTLVNSTIIFSAYVLGLVFCLNY